MESITGRLRQVAQQYPALRSLARQGRTLLNLPRTTRVVQLSLNQLDDSAFQRLKTDPAYNDVLGDLLAFTALSEDELRDRLMRSPQTHFESEFAWQRPKNRAQLTWFYRTSAGYLFANAAHPYENSLDVITGGCVLDFGAGAGCNTIELAKRCEQVDFLEIGSIQSNFIQFRAERRSLTNVKAIKPFHEGRFDPVNCIQGTYDAIVAMDVLEHIPDYHIPLRHLIARLKQGGFIVENSPFDDDAGDLAIHVSPSMPLPQAMVGMERVGPGVWRKVSDQLETEVA